MSETPNKAAQHLSLSIQLSESPRGASSARGTSYGTAICVDRNPDGSCNKYEHEEDSDDVRISAI